MKVIKLTDSDLNHIIRRVIQTEQDTEEETDKNLVVGLRGYSKGRISKDDLYDIDDTKKIRVDRICHYTNHYEKFTCDTLIDARF